jgi:hypothetical protein
MRNRTDIPTTDWPEPMAVTYRSEAFAEVLEEQRRPATVWRLLERLFMALPLICVFAPVADAYLIH